MQRIILLLVLLVVFTPATARAQTRLVEVSDLSDADREAITLSADKAPRDRCTVHIDPRRKKVDYIDQVKMRALIDAEHGAPPGAYILLSINSVQDSAGMIHSSQFRAHTIKTTLPDEAASRILAGVVPALMPRRDTVPVSFRIRIEPSNRDEPMRLGESVMCPPVIQSVGDIERALSGFRSRAARVPDPRVTARFYLEPNGKATKAQIRESSEDAAFDRDVTDRVMKKLRFKPALNDGEKIAVWAQIPMIVNIH